MDPGPILDIGYISPVRNTLVGIVEEQEEWEEEVLAWVRSQGRFALL